jgi:protein TonB
MRVASSAVSLTVHVGLVLTAVWATGRAATPAIRSPIVVPLPPVPGHAARDKAPTLPVPNVPDSDVHVPELPTIPLDGVAPPPSGPVFPAPPRSGGPDDASAPSLIGTEPLDVELVDDPPVLLAARIPAYPEQLRQAGIEGRVVLEAVVDTLGRVEAGSMTVVAGTHPAFVASARQALAGALFRPGRVRGHAVRVRIRLPAQFMLRHSR